MSIGVPIPAKPDTTPTHMGEELPAPPLDAQRLATLLSVATRIEPELIRAMRLVVAPYFSVAAETDLWFSDWVSTRSAEAIVLLPEVRSMLQRRLGALLRRHDRSHPVHRVWAVLARMHAEASPALLLEERVTWLVVANPDEINGDTSSVEDALQPALWALLKERRAGLADWFAGAWRRLPPAARATKTAWQLAQVTARQLPESAELFAGPAPPNLQTADIQAIIDAVDDRPLGVRREGQYLLLGEVAGKGAAGVLVPNTRPQLVELEWTADGSTTARSMTISAGETHRVRTGPVPVRLRTARGLIYDIPLQVADQDDTPRPEAHDDLGLIRPLTLVMAAKSPEDYAALRQLVERLQSLPPRQNPVTNALDKLGTVHFARFVFLNNDQLAMIITYDGEFAPYINEFVNEIGDVFNSLLTHMKDAPPLPVQTYRQEFLEYIYAHNLPSVGSFYSAYPNRTVLDILSEPARRSSVKTVQNPLTLVMTAKSPEDHAALRQLVERLQSLPPRQNPVTSALDKLGTVHFARFVFLNNDQLAMIITYDGEFEIFINEFADEIGDVFNAFLAHVEDAPPLPVQTYRQDFVHYIRVRDLRYVGSFYSAYPDRTVLDILEQFTLPGGERPSDGLR